MIHRCKSHGNRICWFCIGNTVGFPFEHYVWEKLPIFSWITHNFLGLR